MGNVLQTFKLSRPRKSTLLFQGSEEVSVPFYSSLTMDVDATKEWPHVQVMFDACDSSSNASTTQSLNSVSVNTSSSSRSTRSQQMLNVTSIVPTDARNGGPTFPSSSCPSIEKYQESPMLISPPAEDHLEHVDNTPHCTGCKSASPAVANCFSCSSLLCANCVIAHQLMVAFEGHHVTNLGQGKIEAREIGLLRGQSGSIDAVRRMVKEAKKKLNELR